MELDEEEEIYEDGLHSLFTSNRGKVCAIIDDINTMKKASEMFRVGDYLKHRRMMGNGWEYYIRSASNSKISYRVMVIWSRDLNSSWEDSWVFSCTCPVRGKLCKHIAVMCLDCGKKTRNG